MKDVLIMGGAGKIGYDLVQRLVDSKYSITVLDLESRFSIKRLNKYSDKIKIVYGDIEDSQLVMDLIQKNDIVIDYAGIMPPLADLDDNIANKTNFMGAKNIVDAIKEVNPDCFYIYMSFISIYGNTDNMVKKLTVDGDTNNPDDHYSVSIIRSEEYIKSNLKKYTILRMPIVLTRNNYYIKHLKLNRNVDFITKEDLNNIVIGVMESKKAYGKTYNLSGFKANSSVFIKNMYNSTGKVSLGHRKLYFGEYDDNNAIDDIVKTDYVNSNAYFKDLKSKTNPIMRFLRKIINYPKYLIIKKRTK